MNKMTKLVAGIALATCASVSTSAFAADVSYNVGFASEYYYRGVAQNTSSASAGVDLTEGGFYAGAWTADVGDGLEVDGYFGYGIETDSGFTASAGFTGYYYTGDFDETYEEINLNIGYGIASLEYSFGKYDGSGALDDEYGFIALTLEKDGFYGTYGKWDAEFLNDGDYLELGYGFTAADLDLGVAVIFNDDGLTFGAGNDETILFSVGKAW